MKATLTSKGQITIPIEVRHRLHLKPGDVLDFDEHAPYLKASKVIPPKAWKEFEQDWTDPFPSKTTVETIEEFRGSSHVPKKSSKQ